MAFYASLLNPFGLYRSASGLRVEFYREKSLQKLSFYLANGNAKNLDARFKRECFASTRLNMPAINRTKLLSKRARISVAMRHSTFNRWQSKIIDSEGIHISHYRS